MWERTGSDVSVSSSRKDRSRECTGDWHAGRVCATATITATLYQRHGDVATTTKGKRALTEWRRRPADDVTAGDASEPGVGREQGKGRRGGGGTTPENSEGAPAARRPKMQCDMMEVHHQ